MENIPTQYLDGHCKPILSRGIVWNWTRSEETDIRPCPSGSSGLANFACKESRWSKYGPNMGSCKSSMISDLEDDVRRQEPENVIISNLARFIKRNQNPQFFGGDIDGAVAVIRTLTDRLQYLFQTETKPFPNKKSYMQEFFQNIVRSVSALISKEMMKSWMDLDKDRKMNLITNIFSALDDSAFLLADFINNPEILEETSLNLGKETNFYLRIKSLNYC